MAGSAEGHAVRTPVTCFVGRQAQLAALNTALRGSTPARVVFVHGMGGMGKSALVRAFRHAHRDMAWAVFDAQALPADLSTLHLSDAVVVVDGLEQAAGSAELMRRLVVPEAPAPTRFVLVSRQAPDIRWRADLGPQGFVEMELGPLDDQESAALLRHWGVNPLEAAALVPACHGHPLMLALASQLPDPKRFADEGLDGVPAMVASLGG